MTHHDPNQRMVILILGAALIAGVAGLLAAAYKGAPIDVAVVGIVMSIAGAFTGYLNRPATPPAAPPQQPPGTVTDETKRTLTPPIPSDPPPRP